MFNDGRSKRVVFLAHCLLNQNAISDGTAVYPAAFREVIDYFLNKDIGIVQMPCPEFCCLGLDRGDPAGASRPVVEENTRIRAAMQTGQAAKRLSQLADDVVRQIRAYHDHSFAVLGVIGANRSPNCGVETTSARDMEVSGKGLFMEAVAQGLAREGITVPMLGLKSTDDIIKKLNLFLNL